MSESDETPLTPVKRKKGVRHPEAYKNEVQKNKRLRGEEYVSITTGVRVPAKSNDDGDCSCKNKCTEKFDAYERQICLKTYLDIPSKNEQDIFLMGLIDRKSPVRRRSTKEQPLKRDSTFVYHVKQGSERKCVCKKAFSILYCVKNKAIFRLTSLLAQGSTPTDKRGKHLNRGNAISEEVRNLIDEHIKEFPLKETHYGNKHTKYLSADLNIKTLYELFCNRYPIIANSLKYDYYRKYYNENHSYRFGRLQIDVCSTCEELAAKIRSPFLNENAKRVAVAEKVVHLRRAKKFYNKQKEVKTLCENDPEVGAIVFDYMQNLPLFKIPVQEMFYLRKLWLYVFCCHDIKANTADFYVYPEGEAKRGPDEVCSLLWLKIKSLSRPDIKVLHVFSDACGGQNRNHTLVAFFLALVAIGRFKKIYQYFPVRGHSFLQCDRNFGVAKRKIRKLDRIYTPEQYADLIKTSRKTSGFNVTEVSSENILDFKNWRTKNFKKTVKSRDGVPFLISKCKQLEYKLPAGYIKAYEYINGLTSSTFLLQKPHTVIQIPEDKSYKRKIPLKQKKAQDVAKIIQYIPDEHKRFYEEIVTRSTSGEDQANDSHDSEADQ